MQQRAISESIDNITNEDKVFNVKINKELFKIDKYTNLAYFGILLLKGVIPLIKAKEQQEQITNIIKKLKKKIDRNKQGHPLGDDNKNDVKND